MPKGDRKQCPNSPWGRYHRVGRPPKKKCENIAGMKRIYTRKQFGRQVWIPIGWWCPSCGKVIMDTPKEIHDRFYPPDTAKLPGLRVNDRETDG